MAVKTWYHVVLVRDGRKVAVYLNGNTEPDGPERLFVGGRNDNFANFAGKIDEVAFYDRVLTPDEVARHYAG